MKDDIDITDRFNDRTTSIQVTLNAGDGEGDRCEIKVDDRDWRVARPTKGDTLSVWLGYKEVGLAYMGTFEVDEVSLMGMPREIQITGLATGMKGIMKVPVIKAFDNKTVGDILGGMAAKAGLTLSISPELAAKTLPFKNQTVSNLHMIHELERLYGAVAKIADGKLLFAKRDDLTSISGVALPTLVLLPEHFGTWHVRYNERNSYTGTKASWFDAVNQVRKFVKYSGDAGDSNPSDALEFTLGTMFKSHGEAEAAAKSQYAALKRGEGKALFSLAKGDPWIRDMQSLLVSGMREGIDGSWSIRKATHSYIKSTGLKTHLECEPPGDGADFSTRDSNDFIRPAPGALMGETLGDLNAAGEDLTK